MELGRDDDGFWKLTPREYRKLADVHLERERRLDMRAGIALGGFGGGAAGQQPAPARRSGVRALVRPGERQTTEQAEAAWDGWRTFFQMAEGAAGQRRRA